jgi:hypothetical protein
MIRHARDRDVRDGPGAGNGVNRLGEGVELDGRRSVTPGSTPDVPVQVQSGSAEGCVRSEAEL